MAYHIEILKFEETDEMVKNKEKEINLSELYNSIIDLLNIYADILDPDTYSEVMHYLEHGEYEMAYEGLFIDLIKANFQPQKIDMGYYLKICIKLKLNNENIFNADFWEYLNNYLKKQQLYLLGEVPQAVSDGVLLPRAPVDAGTGDSL